MVQAAISFPCSLKFALQPKTSYLPSSSFVNPIRNRRSKSRVAANLGGDGEIKRPEKKFITREEEPEQLQGDYKGYNVDITSLYPLNNLQIYWQTAGEKEGENPMKTPLPYIIILGMSTPFVILAIAFVNGWIKVPAK